MAASLEEGAFARSAEAVTKGPQPLQFVNGTRIVEGTEIKADDDFSLWAQDVQDDLLEASLDGYQYDSRKREAYNQAKENADYISIDWMPLEHI